MKKIKRMVFIILEVLWPELLLPITIIFFAVFFLIPKLILEKVGILPSINEEIFFIVVGVISLIIVVPLSVWLTRKIKKEAR